MSDPIERHFRQGQDPIEGFFLRQQAEMEAAVAEERENFPYPGQIAPAMPGANPAGINALAGVLGGLGRAVGAIGGIMDPTVPGMPGTNPIAGVAAAGALAKGILEPVAAVIEFPGALLGYRTNKAGDFLRRAANNLYSDVESAAKASGMTDDEIKITYDIGGFIGMSLPIVASIKGAQLAMGGRAAAESLAKAYTVAGPVTTDLVAGAIYGGLFHEGNASERLKHLSRESAMWGAFRLVVGGSIPAFIAWRNKRAYEMDREGYILRRLEAMSNGERGIPKEDMPGVLQLLNEENWILSSDGALQMLEQGRGDQALAAAIVELGQRRATGGVFKSVGATFEEATARIGKFKEQFPNLKFSLPIKRELAPRLSNALEGPGPAEQLRQTAYDVYFGVRGLSGKQLKQLKVEGRFEGQILQDGSSEVVYVGRGLGKKRTDRIRVKYQDADGNWKVKHIKESRVTETPFIKEEWERTPQWDTVYQNFQEWVTTKGRQIAESRGSLSEYDLIEAIRTGKVHIAEDGRRAFSPSGALLHPEELGLVGEEAVTGIKMRPVPLEDGSAIEPFITRNVGQGVSGQAGWRLNIPDPSGVPAHHFEFATLDEAVTASEGFGYEIAEVVKKYPTGKEVAGLIAQEGTGRAMLLNPAPTMTFEDMFGGWARERGLPEGAVDYAAMQDYFRDRMRRWAWQQVPKEERAVFEALRAEQEKMLAEGDLPIEVLAHSKGFWAQRLPSGQIAARHIETGLPVIFGGERTAREGLVKLMAPEATMPSIIDLGIQGLHTFTGGLPLQDLLHFPDNILSLETAQDIRWQSIVRYVRNLRDVFIAIERQSGLPIYTEGLDPLLKGREAFTGAYDPFAKIIQKTWKGIKKPRREAVVDFWVSAEHRKLSFQDATQEMVASGTFTAQEVQAFRRSRAILDDMFERTGISAERYIETYYSRLRPFYETNKSMDIMAALSRFDDVKPQELNAWYELTRHGDTTVFEKDPEMMLHKYVRSVLWKEHVKPHWDKMAILTGTKNSPPIKIKDLPVSDQLRIMQNPMEGTTPDSPVLPTAMRDVIKEFLVAVRGMPNAAEETARSFSASLLHKLGVQGNPAVLEEFSSVMMSMWYGSALALRPATQARNMTQVIWNLYTRQGGKHLQTGMQRALEYDGFEEALLEGVFHMSEAGIPYGDKITETMLEAGFAGEKGPMSMALASAIRKGLRAGTITKATARKMLVPYASSDQVSRGWAYWSTKLHTDEWLTKFESGKISYDKFEEEGLAFFDPVIKKKFRQTYDFLGREKALRFAGRMGSDEANFLYVTGVQPAVWQHPVMRMFGMFGTYPVWQAELYANRMWNGTPAQIAKFAARNAMLGLAIGNMAYQTGTNMWAWIAPLAPFGWAGGPATEQVINMRDMMHGSLDERQASAGRMVNSGMRLFFPGQGFVRDLSFAAAQDDPNQAFFSLMLGRPLDDTNWSVDYLYDPIAPPFESYASPETRQRMSEGWPLPKASTIFEFGLEPDTEDRTSASTEIRTQRPAPLSQIQGNVQLPEEEF